VAANTTDASLARANNEIIQHASQQLHEYFSGQRTHFTLPLEARGTEFQQLAWRQLQTIPYAATRSYQWQCQAMGRPKAARAVGSANGRNPLPIIIPCHRIIGANGTLTGYSGGLAIKQFLLSCERFFGDRAGSSSSDR
jgi:methylated-DNA-[protein]-cysteine S-methyltransferase